ncbi:MAG: Ig-like domain-containing protein [Thermoanaerobaculia bacterium]|nr:Ig-like domain-containing protein [Thermoanaerobaculia bacterium]
MSKRVTLGLTFLALLLSLLAAPAAAQEDVRGFFEGLPNGYNGGTGALPLTGWVLADSGVRRVVIEVNGVPVGQTVYGHFRPDVLDLFPGYPDSAGAGFTFNLNTTDFENGVHTVTAQVLTNNGTIRTIEGRYEIFFNNNTSTLRPFGEIDIPQRHADLFGTCDLVSSNRIYEPVEGWALDLGVEIGDTGIGYVELLMDGAIVANSRTGCSFNIVTGGLTDCYGLRRLDIERIFPFALNSPSAGFRFVLDVGALIAGSNVSQGFHMLTIRAGDIATNVENIAEIPVNFFCEQNETNPGSFGFIEMPRPGVIVAGDTVIQGWALDIDGINRVEVFVDGIHVGNATYGVDSRPAVANEYPGYPDAAAPVWRLTWDSTSRTDGFHEVEAVAVDDRGASTIIGERTFFTNNGID